MVRSLLTGVVAVLGIALIGMPADAQELVMGNRVPPAVDPHFSNLTSNQAYSKHIFNALTFVEADGSVHPNLATSWRQLEARTWEFKLRKGVKFHDGSDFTAEDVVFSIKRVRELPNNPNPYTASIASIESWDIPDPHTIIFHTSSIDSVLIQRLDSIYIVSHKAAANATPADFASGKAAIGTGPFKLVEYVPGSHLILERNEDYWGDKPHWQKVTIRIISNDAARVAALLGGDVDMIEFVPTPDVEALRKNANVTVWQTPSDRFMYWVPHQRDKLAFTTAKDGKPLDKNPLQDIRVRKAISLAINRKAMIERVMTDLASPARSWVPKGMFGYIAGDIDPYDPEKSKQLLAEAGYPDGFKTQLNCSNDRYVNDAKICLATAQMLARIGIQASVETEPISTLVPKLRANKIDLFLLGAATGGSANAINHLLRQLHTPVGGLGVGNFGQYFDPELDAVTDEAANEIDPEKREALVRKGMKMAWERMVVIPLHHQVVVAATKKSLNFRPRFDEQTLAINASPAS